VLLTYALLDLRVLSGPRMNLVVDELEPSTAWLIASPSFLSIGTRLPAAHPRWRARLTVLQGRCLRH
ncbi:MAG: hypothetical protein WBA53_17230, partial [Burkholderiaceae bacterium]